MKTLSLSEAKMKFSSLINDLTTTEEEIHITKNGKTVAVLITPDEMERLMETKTILSDKELVTEIKRGLKDFTFNKTKLYTLDELLS